MPVRRRGSEKRVHEIFPGSNRGGQPERPPRGNGRKGKPRSKKSGEAVYSSFECVRRVGASRPAGRGRTDKKPAERREKGDKKMANKQEKNGIKKLVAGVAIGLAVVMSLGALVIAGKAMGWFEKASEEPQETLEALNFEETAYGTYAVSLKDYDAEEVVIPEEYEGKKVTEIQGNSYLPLFINIEEL